MVEIISYKDGWPFEFLQIGTVLRNGLGRLALRIDHIGSTSIPGLAAKDIIDIQVTVAELNHAVLAAMLNLGYTKVAGITCDHRPAGAGGVDTDWVKWYFRPPINQRPTHLHMRLQGQTNQRYPLLFRDYLRAHPQTAHAYAELKRRLAHNLADPETYSDVKDPAVDLIYLAAEEWGTAIKWMPGESDA